MEKRTICALKSLLNDILSNLAQSKGLRYADVECVYHCLCSIDMLSVGLIRAESETEPEPEEKSAKEQMIERLESIHQKSTDHTDRAAIEDWLKRLKEE